MIRKNELLERLGTTLNSTDTATERLKDFMEYLADNYSANENGGTSIEEAIYIARKQIGEVVIDNRQKQNVAENDGNLLSNGQAYGARGNWTVGFFLRYPRDAVQFLAVQAKQQAIKNGDQAAATKYGALAEGISGKRHSYDNFSLFQGKRTNDMVNIERRYIGGADGLNAAFNSNKAGFFDRLFRRTSRQYKDFEKEFKAYKDGARDADGINSRNANRESVERTAKAYLRYKIPGWNGEGLPTQEQLNALRGKSKDRAMLCFNVLSATKDSKETEQKLDRLVETVENQMQQDGTGLATNRLYEANSIDANEIKGVLSDMSPVEQIVGIDGSKSVQELTNAQKHFQQSLAKDLEERIEGVNVKKIYENSNEELLEHDDMDMSMGS